MVSKKQFYKLIIYFCLLFLRYRAEVLEIINKAEEKMAKLYYLDYGDTDILPCKDLYELRTDLLRLHFQAVECFLARVGKINIIEDCSFAIFSIKNYIFWLKCSLLRVIDK